MLSPLNCSDVLQYNGDIAGAGVRVSFYIQNFILVLMVQEDAENALWTLVATSFGLTVAALAQVKMGQLTLLQGMLVSQLAWFAIFGTYLSLASYSRSKGRDSIVKIAAVLQGYFSMTLTIAMWAFAHNLPLSQCSDHPKFVFLFGVTVDALGTGKKVALAFSSIVLVIFTVFNVIEFRQWYERRKKKRREGRGQHRKQTSRRRNLEEQRSQSYGWIHSEDGSLLLGIIICQVFVLVYFIATTELIIHKSNASDSDSTAWGFGQILALTVVLPPLIALGRLVWERLYGKEAEAENVDPALTVPLNNLANGHV
ncbi:hypothetical protein M422DRAFT_781918 [Sphaerobolus stellatus SS14]|uniref:Uncharacterized protein n=1 Tax=Sphaerobolus stellatus (strain SS14) TaxID=990650 RepID=A0A0C9V642_SPHS4|nr:hypothetical protein M422DRAFT_781918 [Sphaerobolus stellatus SS14]